MEANSYGVLASHYAKHLHALSFNSYNIPMKYVLFLYDLLGKEQESGL